jgi:hypothetical protein
VRWLRTRRGREARRRPRRCDERAADELAAYRAIGGYDQLEKARAQDPQAVIQELIESNLRGRGGAFFPTGRKASFIRPDKIAKPIYITVNADESEPGTFKDREIMLKVPHRLIEGCLIAAAPRSSRRRSTSTSAASTPRVRGGPGRPRRGERARLLGSVDIAITAAQARTSAARRRRSSSRSRGSGAAAAVEASVPCHLGRLRRTAPDQQRRVDHHDPADPGRRPRGVRQIGSPPDSTGSRLFCLSGNVEPARGLRGPARDHRAAT